MSESVEYRVCRVEDVPPGEKRTYTVKNIPIVLIHSKAGAFYAIYSTCPHQHGNLGLGALGGLTEASQPGDEFRYVREGEILRCPWHGFSFDVTTGTCLTEPHKLRVRTYDVHVHDQQVYLEL
jgi:3-phenylpropionate/trans-cinnamate dioxygenase ferredoxin subunit